MRIRPKRNRRRVPEAAAAVTCLSCFGCCGLGLKIGGIACLVGLVAGASEVCESAVRSFLGFLNWRNARDWKEGMQQANDLDKAQMDKEFEQGAPIPPHEPMGVILELPYQSVLHLGDLLYSWIYDELLGASFSSRLFRYIEPYCRQIMTELVERDVGANGPNSEKTQELTVPFVLECEVLDKALEVQGWPQPLRIPHTRCSAVVEFGLENNELVVKRAYACVPDALLETFAQSLRTQVMEVDFRQVDPRLDGLTKPACVEFKLGIEWQQCDKLQLKFSDVRSRLDLPD